MKKFRFKLQTLLDQRQSIEEALQAELGALLREESVELLRLQELHKRLEQAWRYFDQLSVSVDSSATAFEVCDTWSKALRDDIKVQILTIEAVRSRVEIKKSEVVEAMKQRKVIEALRDRKEREYLHEQALIEQNTLDEIASLAYARRL